MRFETGKLGTARYFLVIPAKAGIHIIGPLLKHEGMTVQVFHKSIDYKLLLKLQS